MMTVDQYNRLSDIAQDMQKRSLEQVSVADLIRDSIDIYLEALEDEQQN
jgi:hypothetical protein|tara:strand:+ start:637 stop:783 length:147 start_codon:yes stop_codon:yes gene_type:complete